MRDRVFSKHEIGLNPVDSEENQILCPNCRFARLEPQAFDPDTPVEKLVEEEER